MIHLRENEKIVMMLHKHWIVLFGHFAAGLVLSLLPLIAVPAILSIEAVHQYVKIDSASPIILFFEVIYLMVIILLLFLVWADYYLDMWVITDERIIDIEQRGLFRREVSEFMIDKVQDITVETPNFTATILKYGNIIIQTAGERSFEIKQIPRVHEAKNIILDYSYNKLKNVGAQQVGADKT